MVTRPPAPVPPGSTVIVDVPSNGWRATDPALAEGGCKGDNYRTGHVYIRCGCQERDALAEIPKVGVFDQKLEGVAPRSPRQRVHFSLPFAVA